MNPDFAQLVAGWPLAQIWPVFRTHLWGISLYNSLCKSINLQHLVKVPNQYCIFKNLFTPPTLLIPIILHKRFVEMNWKMMQEKIYLIFIKKGMCVIKFLCLSKCPFYQNETIKKSSVVKWKSEKLLFGSIWHSGVAYWRLNQCTLLLYSASWP